MSDSISFGSRKTFTMALQNVNKSGYVDLEFDSYRDFADYYIRAPTLTPKDEDSTIGQVIRGVGLPMGTNRYSNFIAHEVDEPSPIIFGYEVIKGYQCPYWDFDGRVSEDDFKLLVKAIQELMPTQKICINLYNSNGKRMNGAEKFSYHVVVKGVFVKSHKECAALTSRVIEKTGSMSLKTVYDAGVYTSRRNLRMIGSRKVEDRRTKVFDRILFKSEGYRSAYTEDPLYMSLVIGTEDSVLFEVKVDEQVYFTERVFEGGIKQENFAEIKELLEQDYSGVFEPDKLVNGLLSMKRKKSAYCKVCEKTHDRIDCFITLIRGEFFFHCYRNPKVKHSLSNAANGEEEVEMSVVDEKDDDGGEIESAVPQRMIKTRRGDIPIETYVKKLVKIHQWY